MAGWFDKSASGGSARQNLIKISRFGNEYDDLLLKNSQAIGYIEGELKRRNGTGLAADSLMQYSMAISDTTSSMRGKMLAFFKLDYPLKRDKLRDIASNAEIEFVIDTIADDTIVYGPDGYFCKPSDISLKLKPKKGVTPLSSPLELSEEAIADYYSSFYEVYDAWGFDSGIGAWQYFFQWLIEGIIAFEIIYDNPSKPTKIIGFKDLDPAYLFPVTKMDSAQKLYIEWIQKDPVENNHRTLTDAQVIYISYGHFFRTKRAAFVERMVRSFNMLRIIEHSKVIWHIMNAPVRLKTTVPIGTQSLQKSKEAMNEFLNTFKEDIHFNQESGELLVDGQPKILFYKNYVVPVNDRGEKIDIDTIEHKGPDLQDNQLLSYFLKRLKLDSKLPFSRWDYNEGGGSYLLGPDTVSREEIAYAKFCRRLATAFQEILMKPWYIQMCLKHEAIAKHSSFKKLMGLEYQEESLFMRLKEAELITKNVATIKTLQEIKLTPDTVFHTNFLVKKYLDFNQMDIDANKTEWETDKTAKQAAGTAAAGTTEAAAPAAGGGGGAEAPAQEAPAGPIGAQGQAQAPAAEETPAP